jgi:2-C-methyl-D-erythritol 4-phosphate cytidylyltransferase
MFMPTKMGAERFPEEVFFSKKGFSMQKRFGAVIAAAGISHRMNGIDKLWHLVGDRPLLAYTIDAFERSPLIEVIILVVNARRINDSEKLCRQQGWEKVMSIIPGGDRRQDSIHKGLDKLAEISPTCQWVMTHDGARPFVTPSLLEAGAEAISDCSAAIPVVATRDPIKEVQHQYVQCGHDRSRFWMAQTPQIFSLSLIRQAYFSPIAQEEAVDDATLLERLELPVATFTGSSANIKMTTRDDLLLAEALIARG